MILFVGAVFVILRFLWTLVSVAAVAAQIAVAVIGRPMRLAIIGTLAFIVFAVLLFVELMQASTKDDAGKARSTVDYSNTFLVASGALALVCLNAAAATYALSWSAWRPPPDPV